MRVLRAGLLGVGVVLSAVASAVAQHHGKAQGSGHPHVDNHAAAQDVRTKVEFPPALAAATLANMRDHLFALQEIQAHLGRGENAKAAAVAESRLGMSSLQSHGAHDVAKFMPQAMRDAGTAMHRAASRFAVEAQNSDVTGDLKPALGALADVTARCVACHAAYRLN